MGNLLLYIFISMIIVIRSYPDILLDMPDTRYYLRPGIKYRRATTFPDGANRVKYCFLFYSSEQLIKVEL